MRSTGSGVSSDDYSNSVTSFVFAQAFYFLYGIISITFHMRMVRFQRFCLRKASARIWARGRLKFFSWGNCVRGLSFDGISEGSLAEYKAEEERWFLSFLVFLFVTFATNSMPVFVFSINYSYSASYQPAGIDAKHRLQNLCVEKGVLAPKILLSSVWTLVHGLESVFESSLTRFDKLCNSCRNSASVVARK